MPCLFKRLPLACACVLAVAIFLAARAQAEQTGFEKLLAEKQELTFLLCSGQGDSLDAACADTDGEDSIVCKTGTCQWTAADESMTFTWKAQDGKITLENAATASMDYKGRFLERREGDQEGVYEKYMHDDMRRTFPSDFSRLFEQAQSVTWYNCDGGEDSRDCTQLNRSRRFSFARDHTGTLTDDGDREYSFTWKPLPGGTEATFVHRRQYRFDGRHLVLETESDGPRTAYVLRHKK